VVTFGNEIAIFLFQLPTGFLLEFGHDRSEAIVSSLTRSRVLQAQKYELGSLANRPFLHGFLELANPLNKLILVPLMLCIWEIQGRLLFGFGDIRWILLDDGMCKRSGLAIDDGPGC